MTSPRLCLLLAIFAAAADAQWLNHAVPGIPRGRDGKPDLKAPAPKMADGKPDLSGVWQIEPTPVAELKRSLGGLFAAVESFSVPGMDLADGASKYFLSVFADYKPDEAPKQRPGVSVPPEKGLCLPLGFVTEEVIPAPHKIVQTSQQLVVMYEDDGTRRQIYVDGRKLPKEFPEPTWLGYSAGAWEGDTLVVQSAGFNDRTRLDLLRHPHSEGLHIVERYHRRDFGHMDVEMTFDDPQMYDKPFRISFTDDLLPDTDVLETVCNENERDATHLGHK